MEFVKLTSLLQLDREIFISYEQCFLRVGISKILTSPAPRLKYRTTDLHELGYVGYRDWPAGGVRLCVLI